MSDYTQTIDFSAKDALSSGDPNKIIYGADVDSELAAISTAIATKYDSNDRASQAQAEALSSNTVLMTPLRVANVLEENAGILGDLQALANPAADRIVFWDNSETAAAFLTVSTGLAIATTNLSLSHLGIEALTDPNADAFMVWDDSAGATAFMQLASESGLAISVTPDLKIDISALSSSLTGATIAGADIFLIDDGAGGTNKKIAYQDFGIPQTDDATTTPMSAADLTYANRWFNCNNASAISFVIPANGTVAYPVGTTFLIHQRGAGQVTVSVTSPDTLRSPNGAKTYTQYSVIAVTKVASTEWVVFGDTTT